ncbi:MAG TPA: hypothetical protein PLQ81_11205, partial [bacterium]|nr:hypothetical protein [bacterium]
MSNGIIIEYKYFSDYKKAILLFYYGFLIISLTNLIEYKIVKFDLLNDFIGAFFLLYSVKLLKSLPVSA